MLRKLALTVWLAGFWLVACAPAAEGDVPNFRFPENGPVSWLPKDHADAKGIVPFDSFRRFASGTLRAMESHLLADAADGRLANFTPLGAALVAGGVDNADELRAYERKAAALADALAGSIAPDASPHRRAEAVLAFLHRRVLHSYDLAATDLRRALDDGRFNCVSATVLFNYFAERAGLRSCGLEMPGHAMSRVLLADGALDGETTCPCWFGVAGDSSQPPGAAGKTIGRAVAPGGAPLDPRKAREVSPIQLAAMIYYNRGVDALAEKRFADAAADTANALRLDPGTATARGNLLATINNWSIELGNALRFAEAADLLRQGLALDAKFDAFARNYVHVHHRWVERLCDEGRFEEAGDILARAVRELPGADKFTRTESELLKRRAQAMTARTTLDAMRQWPVHTVGPVD